MLGIHAAKINTFSYYTQHATVLDECDSFAYRCDMGIGKLLADLAEKMEWSDNRVARESGVLQPTVTRIFNGESAEPRRSNVEKIANALGYSYTDILAMQASGGLISTSPPSAAIQSEREIAAALRSAGWSIEWIDPEKDAVMLTDGSRLIPDLAIRRGDTRLLVEIVRRDLTRRREDPRYADTEHRGLIAVPADRPVEAVAIAGAAEPYGAKSGNPSLSAAPMLSASGRSLVAKLERLESIGAASPQMYTAIDALLTMAEQNNNQPPTAYDDIRNAIDSED